MKKYKHLVIGGIQTKIFNLVLITILLIVAVFAVVFAEVPRFAGVFFFPVLAAIGAFHLKE